MTEMERAEAKSRIGLRKPDRPLGRSRSRGSLGSAFWLGAGRGVAVASRPRGGSSRNHSARCGGVGGSAPISLMGEPG